MLVFEVVKILFNQFLVCLHLNRVREDIFELLAAELNNTVVNTFNGLVFFLGHQNFMVRLQVSHRLDHLFVVVFEALSPFIKGFIVLFFVC